MNEQSGKYKGMVKRRMNIFVFGNGFDLAHGLYTKYIYDMGDSNSPGFCKLSEFF